jgi:hypothetical protein
MDKSHSLETKGHKGLLGGLHEIDGGIGTLSVKNEIEQETQNNNL